MTTKIDDLNTRYFIPGVDLGTTAAADSDGIEEDYADAPYSQIPAVTDMPSPTGWQDLLGLNQVPPSAAQIAPPPRPISINKGTTANAAGARALLKTPSDDSVSTGSGSLKVRRMIDMLAGYDLMMRRLRARGYEGSGQ